MSSSANPNEAQAKRRFLAPRAGGHPVDHCVRCGVETSPGVALCEQHNRGHISGPSATQMHATIFGGIVLGVIAFLVVANLAVISGGPFASSVVSSSPGADGTLMLAFTLTNEGDADAVADCRVTRDGVPRPDDFSFRTDSVPAGGSVSVDRQLLAPPEGSVGYDADAVTVLCS